MNRHRIAIVDDHQLFIDGLKHLLSTSEKFEVVATATSREALFELLQTETVNVITLDIQLGTDNGIEIARKLKQDYPELRILIVSSYSHISHIKQLMAIGVDGYILKQNSQGQLLQALDAIVEGRRSFAPEITEALTENLNPNTRRTGIEKVSLTKREYEVLQHVASGLTTPEISAKLFVAETTINTHRKHIMEKLEVKNVAELIRYATEMGLLQ